MFAGAGHRQGSPAKHAHTHTQTSNFLKPAAPDSAIFAGDLSPPRWTPGTGLHRALYADDGLIECLKRWTRGSRDRIIVTLVNLAKHFGVVKEVVVELVDTLGRGVDKSPWDDIGGAAKRMISQDFVENQRCMLVENVSPDRPLPYFPSNEREQ